MNPLQVFPDRNLAGAHGRVLMTEHEARNGREAPRGLDEIWRRERRWVAAILLACRPPGAELEDLLQEVALALVRHGRAEWPVARRRAWLRKVALNAARAAARREATRRRHLPRADTTPDAVSAPAENAPANPDGAVRSALEFVRRLPEHYREPLVLRLRGLSQKQIAGILEIPEATVETRLVRARRRLRAWKHEHERSPTANEECPHGR